MSTLLDTVQGNQRNYQAVAALPSFTLFPWFFVAPGVIVIAASGLALTRRGARAAAAVVAVVGVALIAAPVAFQMFTRAPEGGRMMTAFKTLETTTEVASIQSYFVAMADGQGAIRLDIVPSLEQHGLTADQLQRQFPAVSALDNDWVHILNDMTPMIGAMSNNVTNYDAIAALPPFPLFPFFFVLPGVFLVGLVIVARGPRRRPQPGGLQ